MATDIKIENLGIAEVLKRFRLKVPSNQREYAWTDTYVTSLLNDLTNAMRKPEDESYFLGTIVLMQGSGEVWEVADGQQRLATTSMIFASIRDCYEKMNNSLAAGTITSEYLYKYDNRQDEFVPRLTLNLDDNGYFQNCILKFPTSTTTSLEPSRRSHRLIKEASDIIEDRFRSLSEQYGLHFKEELVRWEDFLLKSAKLIILQVSDKRSAFVMFETLNDRGLKTSQVDLVKNHLFDKAGDRLEEAQGHWSRMRGTVDSIGDDDDDLIIEFLRLSCCLIGGRTTTQKIMEKVQQNSQNKADALKLITFLDDLSSDYASILNPESPKWNGYDDVVRKSIRTILLLGVKQIRPLLLAVARHFEPPQAAKTFRRLVAWSVRFQMVGARGGKLDEGYANLAFEIHEGRIKTDTEIGAQEKDFVPTDGVFRESFKVAKVNITKLARYYLRALEQTHSGESHPEFVPNEDTVINLEHVMSQVPSDSITIQDIETHYARLGNMALLQAPANSAIGSKPFSEKRDVIKSSAYALTSMIGENDDWEKAEIEKRQEALADLAVKTWKL